MTYENNKSIILTILVITSVVLTWNLWTYKPEYEFMDKSNYVQDVALSEQKEVSKIVQPNQIIYHFDFSHFGTTSNAEVDRIIQEIDNWKFYDFEDISGEIKNLPEFIHVKGNVEIIFPDDIPISLYKKVINIEDKKIPDFSFNRIVIDVENKTKEDGTIYFVQYGHSKTHRVVASHIKSSTLKKFHSEFYSVSNQMTRYFPYEVTKNRTMFLPENRTNIKSYDYYLELLNPEKFRDALFNDPSVVQKNVLSSNVEYTDASSMMEVDSDSMLLAYINPVEEMNNLDSSSDLLQNSIDFVNEHGGWTGLYKYESMDERNNRIIFRLFDSSGIPIFNDSGLAEIVEVWGKQEIYKYIRPIMSLSIPLRTEAKEVTLISGREVIELLQAKKGFKPELLEDLVIGFALTRDVDEPQLVNLDPAWFYRYNQTWYQITETEIGGLNSGLE
jgi:regulatory protein YycH of two-component signal transduction system YycFG